jgi:uncharacterized DUF497 family protein
MRLYEVIWKEVFVDKLEQKHRVMPDEVEQVLFSKPFIRRAEKGRVQGEDVYVAYGQTAAGRYLVVFFILKYQTAALPISARNMTQAERRYYAQQRQTR